MSDPIAMYFICSGVLFFIVCVSYWWADVMPDNDECRWIIFGSLVWPIVVILLIVKLANSIRDGIKRYLR